ncbi:MAG: ATP-binding protein, partial [Desulfocapsaceae bacterium]|nr:ATP-binding protein [Desulfocapsaceae bacterium]
RRLKKVYANGMKKTVHATTKLIDKEALQLHFFSFWLAVVSGVGALLLLVTWLFAMRSARSWTTERRGVEDEIRRLNEELEAKVRERTEQLQEVQDELLRKEKLAILGQVAGSVGHELRNPLGVMSNAVYFLQTVLEGSNESVKEYLGIILDEITRSEFIVEELFAAVRTPSPDLATHGVAELIDQILHQCAVPASVTVTLDIPATIQPVRVDALQMQQVLRNFISNGVEAMPEGGELVIRAVENRQEGTVIIHVQDSGKGMTPEVLSKLFQPLFTTKARGIGLGLVVAKNLIKANGGHIEMLSEPGKGALVSIILPGDYEKEIRMVENSSNEESGAMKYLQKHD